MNRERKSLITIIILIFLITSSIIMLIISMSHFNHDPLNESVATENVGSHRNQPPTYVILDKGNYEIWANFRWDIYLNTDDNETSITLTPKRDLRLLLNLPRTKDGDKYYEIGDFKISEKMNFSLTTDRVSGTVIISERKVTGFTYTMCCGGILGIEIGSIFLIISIVQITRIMSMKKKNHG